MKNGVIQKVLPSEPELQTLDPEGKHVHGEHGSPDVGTVLELRGAEEQRCKGREQQWWSERARKGPDPYGVHDTGEAGDHGRRDERAEDQPVRAHTSESSCFLVGTGGEQVATERCPLEHVPEQQGERYEVEDDRGMPAQSAWPKLRNSR